MEEIRYIEEVLCINPGRKPTLFNECLNALLKYGEDKWWLSSDKSYVAKRQLKEPVLLRPLSVFKVGLTQVLKRAVRDQELTNPGNKALIAEFDSKYISA